MSREEVREAGEALDQLLSRRMEVEGHYPPIVSTEIPGYVVVASVAGDGEPDLKFYREEGVVEWFRRALAWRERYPDDDLVTAMHETNGEGI